MPMDSSYLDSVPENLQQDAVRLWQNSPLFVSVMREASFDVCQQVFQDKQSAKLPQMNQAWFPETDSNELAHCMTHLRKLKQHAMRHIIWWELGIHGDIEDSYHAISDTASALLQQALFMSERLLAPRFGRLKDVSFCVIGLGKLGGQELNLGSDVDLLFVWQGEGDSKGGRKSVSAKEYYNHFSRMLIRLLGEVTEHGLVWPVDMRLRPGGDGAPICLNLDATLMHYLEYGQTWERAMLIKARSVAGDAKLGGAFIEGVSPFIYRRYLDYSSVAALADMKRRIDAQAGLKGIDVGFDVKKGQGGIREVEFIIQSLQLVHGGRNGALRQYEGKCALDNLVKHGYLPDEEAVQLYDAYLFWRKIEHAIQARKGEQTQLLPDDYEAYLERILGMEDIQKTMQAYSEWVSAVFHQRVFPLEGENECNHDSWLHGGCLAAVVSLSDENKSRISQVFQQIDKQLLRGVLPERSREQVEVILQAAMPYWLGKENIVATIQAFSDLLHAISGRATWLDLLATHQGTRDWLIGILSASKYLSSQIIKNPSWLEWPLEKERGRVENQRLCAKIDGLDGQDEESFLRELGRFVDQARLQCALHIHADREGPSVIGGWLADIADSAARACLRSSLQQLGLPQSFQMVSLALGKHGSREMGLVSDLDMVFVLVENPTNEVHGRTSREWAQRLGRRMIRQLTGMPPFGAGYEFDARLRPSGNSGVLVTTLDGFADYQHHEAQTWEHQVLCRARAVTGSEDARQQVMTLIQNVIQTHRDFQGLSQDVWIMRQKMLAHLASKKEGIINLKQDKGGLIDIEFLAQFSRLMFGGQHVGTVNTLRNIPNEAPSIWEKHGQRLADIYTDYRRMENIIRVELWQSISRLPVQDSTQEWLMLQTRVNIDSPRALRNTMDEVFQIFLELLCID